MLKDILKKETLKEIRRIDLNLLSFFPKSDEREIIKFAYRKKYITDSELEKSLEEAVFSCAKMYYSILMKTKNGPFPENPECFPRPEFLVYAISKEIFSKKELRDFSSCLQLGETLEGYCKVYCDENLLKNLKQELLYPKPRPKLTLAEIENLDLEHPDCLCD